MMGGSKKLEKELWRDQNIVILPSFREDYQPLRILKISKKKNAWCRSKETVTIWDKEELAVLEHPLKCPPEISPGAPMQHVAIQSERRASFAALVKAVFFGAQAAAQSAKGDRYDFNFYSKKVLPHDLFVTLRENGRVGIDAKWESLLENSSQFGIITEVYYAKEVLIERTQDFGGKVAASEPTAQVGVSAEVENTSNGKLCMQTEGFQAIAFKFMLVLWDEKTSRWKLNENPSKKPVAMGVNNDDEENQPLWMEEYPDVYWSDDE